MTELSQNMQLSETNVAASAVAAVPKTAKEEYDEWAKSRQKPDDEKADDAAAAFKPKLKKRGKETESVYTRALITRTISVPMTNIGSNVEKVLESYIAFQFEGKCIVEGFVKAESSKIITYSSGLIQGINVMFEVVFECLICYPVEGMNIYCVARNITKAGIRAESSMETPSPFVVFVARDHHFNMQKFQNFKEGDKFVATVIAQKFELNDKYISIIAEMKDVKYVEPRINNRPPIKSGIDC
jgi:DNA-directed RNA polymerase subunit E'/Rpb7